MKKENMETPILKEEIDIVEELKETKQIIVKTLLQGVIVILPLAIIIFLLSLTFGFVFNMIEPISRFIAPSEGDPHWLVDIFALLILAGLIMLMGGLTEHRFGRSALKGFENQYLNQIPLYSTIRETVQQFSGLKEMPFQQVVLVDPFGNGVMMTGFITEEISPDLFTVFVPTAPNPTNGNIYHVPASKLTFLKISADGAMRSVIGMGTGSSSLFDINAPSIEGEQKQNEVIENLKDNGII